MAPIWEQRYRESESGRASYFPFWGFYEADLNWLQLEWMNQLLAILMGLTVALLGQGFGS